MRQTQGVIDLEKGPDSFSEMIVPPPRVRQRMCGRAAGVPPTTGHGGRGGLRPARGPLPLGRPWLRRPRRQPRPGSGPPSVGGHGAYDSVARRALSPGRFRLTSTFGRPALPTSPLQTLHLRIYL